MMPSSPFYTMEAGGLQNDPVKEAALKRMRPLRLGLIVLRSLQMSLAFAAFVVTAAWLASYVPIGKSLRRQPELEQWWRWYLGWLDASVGISVCLMLLAIISLIMAMVYLWFTVRQDDRRTKKFWCCHMSPDPRYTSDLVGDVSTAAMWFLLLIIMAIVDKQYMDKLGITLADIPVDPLAVSVVVMPVLVLVVSIISAVFSGLMRKQHMRQSSSIVPQHFITTYNI